MHILVSFCNLQAPGLPALGLFDSETSEFRTLRLPERLREIKGITGLASDSRLVYCIAQTAQPAAPNSHRAASQLLIFDQAKLDLVAQYDFQMAADVHSLAVAEDRLYVVSTGTDEVIELRLHNRKVVAERVFWRPDPTGPRADVQHLNAISSLHGELLVCGFGVCAGRDGTGPRDGYVLNIATGERIVSGLDQPHSIVSIDGRIGFCESRKMSVQLVGDARAQQLPGYPRGLCADARQIFVATSVGRKISRSTGGINNPADISARQGRCTISRLSLSDFSIEETIDLTTRASEIYDLLPVEGVYQWPIASSVAWRDEAIGGLATVLDERTIWAKQLKHDLDQRTSELSHLTTELERRTVELDQRNAELLHRASEHQWLRDSLQQERQQRDQLAARTVAQRKTVEKLAATFEGLQTAQQTLAGAVTSHLERITESFERMSLRQDRLETQLVDFTERLLNRQDDLQGTLYALQLEVEQRLNGADSGSLSGDDRQIKYRQMIARIRELVQTALPRDAVVLVASKGDSKLLQLYGRTGWHFPQTEQGVYAGYYPADGTSAVAHLEALRAKGARYLLLPETALWWLDRYASFRQYLERYYRLVVRDVDTCVIYELRETEPEHASPQATTLEAACRGAIAQFQEQFDRPPSILDWHTGQDLQKLLPEEAVFSPPSRDRFLPYLDRTVDLVIIPHDAPSKLTEARRVAQAAVIKASAKNNRDQEFSFDIEWCQVPSVVALPRTAVIVMSWGQPVDQDWLAGLLETLPPEQEIPILLAGDDSAPLPQISVGRLKPDSNGASPTHLNGQATVNCLASYDSLALSSSAEILAFIDTRVWPQHGWLTSLVQTLRNSPLAGAVGGKLLAFDGRLAEAGRSVLADGSCACRGAGEYNPASPAFNHLRPVDACSGMFLVTLRHVFSDVGGFDTSYRSSYFDLDYCLAARQRGLQVVFQPEASAVLLDQGQSGVGAPIGAAQKKPSDLSDEELFVRKWRHVLRQTAPSLLAATQAF